MKTIFRFYSAALILFTILLFYNSQTEKTALQIFIVFMFLAVLIALIFIKDHQNQEQENEKI